MYLNILKKDLKRKRAMNVILLVFIMLASMFVSASVNNIVSVTTALDDYFEMADVPDYFAQILNKVSGRDIYEVFENVSAIDELRIEEAIFMTPSNTMRDGEPLNASAGAQILQSDKDLAMNYFLEDGNALKSVPQGEVYATYFAEENAGLKAGDKITIEIEGVSREFTFAGVFKDALGGTQMLGITRFIVSAEDFDEYLSDGTVKDLYGGSLCYLHTADLDKTLSQISTDTSKSFTLAGDKERLKFCYIFDMMVTGIILVVSLILIIISLVVLRFTITFTLSEEFREIGVMKAIGIRDIKIRGLYLTKYAALSVIGAAVGLALSFPFGKMLMSLSSKSIIISNQNTAFINFICAVLVAAVILLFCLGCTGRVGKMSPIDAVRNGQTGERFRKKSLMSLGRSKLGATSFLAANDIVSSPKRYGIIILTFFLCMSLLIILSNTAASLKSGNLLKYFGLADCHIFADTGDSALKFMTEGGREELEKYLDEMEQTLAKNGMPARCMQEFMLNPIIKCGEYESTILTFQGTGTAMDMYEFTQGTPPQNSGEIALTTLAAKTLRANIGDTIIMSDLTDEREYMVTALYQSMNNQGYAARLYTEDNINYVTAIGNAGMQIYFTDNPDEEEISRRMERIGEMYPEFANLKTSGEWVRETTGVADAIDAVKKMSSALTVILAALITVLMERSFIEKEKAEIALMKAMGMRNSKIYAYHTARFLIVVAAAVAAAELLVVEDNRELAGLLRDFLRRENYTVSVAETGEKALSLYERYGARLIVLDIMLPGMDGLGVCKKIRKESNVPILIVSAKTSKEDKLCGLDLGADDYIEKPYDIDIMLAKINGIFKRRYAADEIIDGDLRINRGSRTVYKNGIQLDMTAKEFDLLLLLAENKGRTLSKEYLFRQVWGSDSFSEQQTLTVHIKWLRQKIEDDPGSPKKILTVWGVGYRFEGRAHFPCGENRHNYENV